jgi:hypothetical protein
MIYKVARVCHAGLGTEPETNMAVEPKHRSREFIDLLKRLDAHYPCDAVTLCSGWKPRSFSGVDLLSYSPEGLACVPASKHSPLTLSRSRSTMLSRCTLSVLPLRSFAQRTAPDTYVLATALNLLVCLKGPSGCE